MPTDTPKQPQEQERRIGGRTREEWESLAIPMAYSMDRCARPGNVTDLIAAAFSVHAAPQCAVESTPALTGANIAAPAVEKPERHDVGCRAPENGDGSCTCAPAHTPEPRLTEEEMREALSKAKRWLARPVDTYPGSMSESKTLLSRALLQLAAERGGGMSKDGVTGPWWISFEEMLSQEQRDDLGISEDRGAVQCITRVCSTLAAAFSAAPREVLAAAPGSGEGLELREAAEEMVSDLQIRIEDGARFNPGTLGALKRLHAALYPALSRPSDPAKEEPTA